MKRLAILGVATALAMPQAHAAALIANCTMKTSAMVKTMPATGDEHLSFGPSDKDIAVEVYDQYGGQWAFIESADKDNPMTGWVLRSSLSKCQNIHPWKR